MNGLGTPTRPDASAGSGVMLASPVPNAIVTDNEIIANELSGNGHGGVVVHAHVPGGDFSGNVVSHNRIGREQRADRHFRPEDHRHLPRQRQPAVDRHQPQHHRPDYYGIFTAGDVTVVGHNRSHHVKINVDGVRTY